MSDPGPALWVTGGRQERDAGVRDRDHRPLYCEPVLLRIAERCATAIPTGAQGQRFGALQVPMNGDATLCTESAVLRLDRDGRVIDRVYHPFLADVHHAIRVEGIVYAASTAAGGVVRLGTPATFVPVDATAEGTRRFAPSPSHPNYLFEAAGQIFVTRGRMGDAISLDGKHRLEVADVVIHDGCPTVDGVWFTAVDGRLVLVDPTSGGVLHTLVLHDPVRDGNEPLGWCRGLTIQGDVAVVGFTRLRATRWRSNLAWLRGTLRGKPIATRRPTHLAAYSLSTGVRQWELDLTGTGVDALFGIAVAP